MSAARGVGWTTAGSLIRQLIQLATSVVLARILLPAAFGLASMTLVFANLAAVLADSGLATALVQRRTITRRHQDTAFTVSVLIGMLASAVLFAGRHWIAGFFGEPVVATLIPWVATTFFVASAAASLESSLYRAMKFRVIVLIELAATLVASAAGIACAVRGWGATSLAVYVAAVPAAKFVLLIVTVDYIPRPRVDRAAARDLSGFSFPLLGFNVLNYANRSSDNVLVGRYLGAEALGYYARAYTLMLLPLSQVSGALARVMFPTLSRIDDPQRVKSIYLRTLGAIAIVASPLMFGLAAIAPDLVPFVFGSAWSPMVPVVRILSLVGLVQSLTTTLGWIYAARGRTDLLLYWGVAVTPVILAGFWIGIVIGSATAVAAAYAVTIGLVLLYPTFAVPGRLIGMRFGEVLRAVCLPIGMGLAMSLVVIVVDAATTGWMAWLTIACQTASGAIAYLAMTWAFRPPAARDVLGFVPPRLTPQLVVNRFNLPLAPAD